MGCITMQLGLLPILYGLTHGPYTFLGSQFEQGKNDVVSVDDTLVIQKSRNHSSHLELEKVEPVVVFSSVVVESRYGYGFANAVLGFPFLTCIVLFIVRFIFTGFRDSEF